jgi:hypothetical protein
MNELIKSLPFQIRLDHAVLAIDHPGHSFWRRRSAPHLHAFVTASMIQSRRSDCSEGRAGQNRTEQNTTGHNREQ